MQGTLSEIHVSSAAIRLAVGGRVEGLAVRAICIVAVVAASIAPAALLRRRREEQLRNQTA